MEIEVVCTDESEHRHRINTRVADIPGFVLPSWAEVVNRRYDVWDDDHIVIDTAHQSAAQSLVTLREQIEGKKR